jgi:outer membrane lipoprotein-sorting protein
VEDIMLEVDPQSFDIRRLLMRYRDGSTNDFVFNAVLTNTGLTDALWEVVPAPGTDIIDMVN